jgi:endopeptidase La
VESLEISNNEKPNVINVLNWNTTDKNKSIVLNMVSDFENISRSDSDKSKYKKWIEKIMKVPVGIIMPPKITKTSKPSKISNYLNNIKKNLDMEIYGHEIAKNQLIKVIAQTISNPNEGGNIFALQGDPGIGKTELMNAVAKSLDRPFTFCSLGGASDGSYLEGHGFTYVGSNNGKITDLLISSKCMNPIIYFDELDKVSETQKGQEIINILMHITDQTQNSHFNDKYFYGFDFDLSKAMIIFSFNDTSKVSKILRDRMNKINIADKHLIPKLIKEIGLDDFNINITKEIITHIVQFYTNESGVRKLKQKLHDILSEINLRRYTHNLKKITITKELLDNDILKKHYKMKDEKVDLIPKIGSANGLYASDGCMVGGTTLIECCFMPSQNKLELQLTGSLGNVMQESMKLAKTIAWKVIPNDIKKTLLEKWNTYPEGIHIHCPEGATEKDGPSAGGVITLCLISLLTNSRVNTEYAMTGEITQQGKITAIGGLQQKIFGAKKEGIKHILCPFENKKDLDEIKEKHPDLFNENFTVEMINNIYDILDRVLVDKIDYVRI